MADWKDLSNVDKQVWSQETKFPHEVWEGEFSRVKLLSVNWDKEYENVVNWKTKENRDKYLAEKAGHVDESLVGWNFKGLEVFKPGLGKHTGSIKVPLPYEYAIDFNYLYIEMYEQPVSPDKTPRREHYCYFITTLNKNSPSNTELFIELDTMSNYLFDVDIQGIQLRRGHYTHALTTADKFLENPLENNIGISIAEPDFPSVKPIVANERLISFQKNEPRVCITTTADFSELDKLWTNVSDLNDVKNNARLEPADKWWENFSDTPSASSFPSDANSPTSPVGKIKPNGATPTMRVYSMSTTDYPNFILKMRNKYPQVIKTINSVFVLDSGLIDESAGINFLGYAFREVKQQSSSKLIEEFKLDKDMFGYDNKYKDFAKFYNGQFASLEVSNLNGQIASINVEDIAENLQIYARSSATFPFLKLEAFINGVGGNNKKQYSVKPWNTQNAELFESSWEDFKFDIDIPTYGIFIEAREEEGPKSAAEISAKLYDVNETIKASKKVLEVGASIDNKNAKRDYDNDTDRINKNYNNDTSRYVADYNNVLSYNKRVNDNDKQSYVRNRDNDRDRYNVEYTNSVLSADNEKKVNNRINTEDRSIETLYNNNIKDVSDKNVNASYNATRDTAAAVKDIDDKKTDLERKVQTDSDMQTMASVNYSLSLDVDSSKVSLLEKNAQYILDKNSTDRDYETQSADILNDLNNVERDRAVSSYNLAQDLMLYNDLQAVTSGSARLNVQNIEQQGILNIIKGGLETLSSVASGFNVASMVGSGVAGLAGISLAQASIDLDAQLLVDQTNLSNSRNTVTLYNVVSGNVLYSGPSKGKIMIDYNQDVGEYSSLKNYQVGTQNNSRLSAINNKYKNEYDSFYGLYKVGSGILGIVAENPRELEDDMSRGNSFFSTGNSLWNTNDVGNTSGITAVGPWARNIEREVRRIQRTGSHYGQLNKFYFGGPPGNDGVPESNIAYSMRGNYAINRDNQLATMIGPNIIRPNDLSVNLSNYNTEKSVITKKLNKFRDSINDVYARDVTVAGNNKDTSTDITNRNYSIDNALTNRTKTSEDSIAKVTRDKEKTIAEHTREMDRKVRDRNYNTATNNIGENLDINIERLDTDVRTNLNTMKAKYYNDIQGAATQYGADSGEAWVDNWGHRGINIRVRRCSKNTERIAGDTFTRFGYYAEGMWVDQPDLSLMTKFTYWETEDIWIYGNNINETNKQIIRDAFNRGVTIWEDPEEVCRVDIYSNKTI